MRLSREHHFRSRRGLSAWRIALALAAGSACGAVAIAAEVEEALRYSLRLDGPPQRIDHGSVLEAVMAGHGKQVTYLLCFQPVATGKEAVLMGKWEAGSGRRKFAIRWTADKKIDFIQSNDGVTATWWVETANMFQPDGKFLFVAVTIALGLEGAARTANIWVNGGQQRMVVRADGGPIVPDREVTNFRVSGPGYFNAYGVVADITSEARLQRWYDGGRARRIEAVFDGVKLSCRADPASAVWDAATDTYTLKDLSESRADGVLRGTRQSAVDYSINPLGLNAAMFADDFSTAAHWLVSDLPGESTTLAFGPAGLTFNYAHTGPPTGINHHQVISKGSYPLLPGTKLVFRVNYDWAAGSGNNCHSGFTVFAQQEQDETNAYFGNLNPENGDQYKIKSKEQNRQTFPEDVVKLRFGLSTGVAKGKDVIIRIDGDSRRIEWLYLDGGREVSLGACASTFPERVRVRMHGRDWGIFPTPDRVTFAHFQVYYENK